MIPRAFRVSAVTVLAAVVIVLVPSLAWLQYRWVGQVSEAAHERMQRSLRTSVAQFATAFDGELSRALAGLQVEGATVRTEDWTSYAQRYNDWADRSADARMVRDVLLVDVAPRATRDRRRTSDDVRADQLRLRRWDNDRRAFVAATWTEDLAAMRAPLAEHLGDIRHLRGQAGPARFRRDIAITAGDDFTLIGPVTLFQFDDDHRTPPRIDVLGFTLVRLDEEYIRSTTLPALAARHFHDEEGTGDYRVAVTDRQDTSRVMWESDPGAAASMQTHADVEAVFMSPRPDQVVMLARGDQRGNPRNGTGRLVISMFQNRRAGDDAAMPAADGARAPFEGRWQIAATHRAGSLEAAVAELRSRNLLLSSGILLLLTTAIGLIVVSARRSQELARQQMEFVAAVSHELRTPVSVIGTAASNLADGVVADPARVRTYGETIQGEARRLGETVERVLQLAGIAAGNAAASHGAVPVDDLVRQSLAACRIDIEARGVNVEVDVPEHLPAVHGDATALRSALQNLVSNAVKYGGDARWVRVEAAALPGHRGLARRSATSAGAGAADAGHVAIRVTDRGIGIAADDRRHIFEPFYRGREAVSRQIQGSGLGLNLVSRIAEAHDGRVEVSSEPGRGSTFTLVLPVSDQPTPHAHAGRQASPESAALGWAAADSSPR